MAVMVSEMCKPYRFCAPLFPMFREVVSLERATSKHGCQTYNIWRCFPVCSKAKLLQALITTVGATLASLMGGSHVRISRGRNVSHIQVEVEVSIANLLCTLRGAKVAGIWR